MIPALSLILAALAILPTISSFPFGAPAVRSVCVDMVPAVPSPHLKQTGSGDYKISINATTNADKFFTYTAGSQYKVTFTATTNPILGYVVQAWDLNDKRIGEFIPDGTNHLLDCSAYSINDKATITHSIINLENSVTLTWIAPTEGDGHVDFRVTIVKALTQYYGPLKGSDLPSV